MLFLIRRDYASASRWCPQIAARGVYRKFDCPLPAEEAQQALGSLLEKQIQPRAA